MQASLLARIHDRAVAAGGLPLRPVATADEVATAEAVLGFQLPEDYREVLLTVANGGFGPGEGLLGVPSTRIAADLDVVEAYARHTEENSWPERLLPVVYLGAECYECIECGSKAGRVIEYNPDYWDFGEPQFGPDAWQARPYPHHPTSGCFTKVVAPSLESLLESWVAGRHW